LEKWGLINLTVGEETLEQATMSIAREFRTRADACACCHQGTRPHCRE
jgi:hypothetical protein